MLLLILSEIASVHDLHGWSPQLRLQRRVEAFDVPGAAQRRQHEVEFFFVSTFRV